MPVKTYEIYLDDDNMIFVYFETLKGEVSSFVVKYVSVIDDEEIEILRFDSGHGIPHIDILHPDKKLKRKVWLPHLDISSALTHAQEDITLNFQFYRERYLQWKKEKEKK